MSKFSKQFNLWHIVNDKKYRTATLYRKALCKKFRNWKSPEDYSELSQEVRALKIEIEKLKSDKQIMVVPKFVAEWFEENKHDLEYKVWEYIKHWDEQEENEFKTFMDFNVNNPIQTIFKMLDGYTVEEEELYYVDFGLGIVSYLNLSNDGDFRLYSKKQSRDVKTKFTESEIKAIDERYWPFAVPVDEAEDD